MPVPCELGWLHCSGIVDNNAHSPGAGHTVAYGAPGIKATFYVYDSKRIDIPSSVEDPITLAEFEVAALAISQQAHTEAWPDPEFDGKCLRRYFKIGRPAEQGGLVALTRCNGKFLKMRATWVRDKFIDAAAAGWVQSVLSQYLKRERLADRGGVRWPQGASEVKSGSHGRSRSHARALWIHSRGSLPVFPNPSATCFDLNPGHRIPYLSVLSRAGRVPASLRPYFSSQFVRV